MTSRQMPGKPQFQRHSGQRQQPFALATDALASEHRPSNRRRKLLSILILTAGVSTLAGSSALADNPHVQRIGRWLGVGWGDGYHVCRDNGFRPGADLPPHGYPHQFGPQAKPAACGQIYPPGTAMIRKQSAACDVGGCDAGNIGHDLMPQSSTPQSVNLAPVVIPKPVMDQAIQAPPRQTYSLSPPATSQPSATPAPSWVTESNQSADSGTVKVNKPVVEAEVTSQPPSTFEMPVEVPSQEESSPSDLLGSEIRLPNVDDEALLEAVDQELPKVNRLPAVALPSVTGQTDIEEAVSSAIAEPDLLNDDSDLLLPSAPNSDNNDDPNPADFQQLIDEELERGSAQNQQTPEGPDHLFEPAVRTNPFFGTGNAAPEQLGMRSPRVALRPADASVPRWNIIVQPD